MIKANLKQIILNKIVTSKLINDSKIVEGVILESNIQYEFDQPFQAFFQVDQYINKVLTLDLKICMRGENNNNDLESFMDAIRSYENPNKKLVLCFIDDNEKI